MARPAMWPTTSSYAVAGSGDSAGSPLIWIRWISSASITSPRWMVWRAARTSSVSVVALQAHAPSRQPSAVTVTAATTSAGRLRSLGGVMVEPVSGVTVRGPGLRSSRAVVDIPSYLPRGSSVHEHLRLADPDLG